MADKDGRNMHFLKLIIKALINSGVINKAMYKISKKFTCSLQGIVVFCPSQNIPDPQQPLPTIGKKRMWPSKKACTEIPPSIFC